MDALRLLDDLVRTETRLYNALNDRLRDEHGIVTSQFEFLRFVRDHPGCRVADLAATQAIGIGASSKGADRLERQGWLRRVPHPDDRRSSQLELTEAGRELLTAAEQTATRRVEELVAGALSPGQVAAAAEALDVLRQALQQARVGTPAG